MLSEKEIQQIFRYLPIKSREYISELLAYSNHIRNTFAPMCRPFYQMTQKVVKLEKNKVPTLVESGPCLIGD